MWRQYNSRSARIAIIAPSWMLKAKSQPAEELKRQLQRSGIRLDDVCFVPLGTTHPHSHNVWIPLGEEALHALTLCEGIDKWRGSILEGVVGEKVIPTLDPDRVDNQWAIRPLVLADFRKAKRESLHPRIVRKERNFIIRPTLQQVEDYLGECVSKGLVSVDIETQWSTRITCVGFSHDPSSAICVPFYDADGDMWNSYELKRLREVFDETFHDSRLVGHNFYYDTCWLKREGYQVNGPWFDTMVAMHAANPQLPKDLATVSSLFTNEPYWKDERKDVVGIKDWDQYYTYNCKDCAITLECMKPLQREIDIAGVKETFEFEMSLIPVFVNQTLRGIRFDRELRNKFRAETRKEIEQAEKELDTLLPPEWHCPKCGGEGTIPFGRANKEGIKQRKECVECEGSGKHLNVRSPKQLSSLIYDTMKLPAAAKKGKRSTDEDALLKLHARYPNPIFQKIIDIRGLGNRYGFLGVKIDSDDRCRTSLACNTYTGRLSSGESPFGTGRNLQNVTHSSEGAKISKRLPLRKLFTADEGQLFINADFSKAEAYVMAFEANDPIYIDALVHGDIHTKNASVIFEKPEASITYDERQIGKRCCHGLNYGMGIRTLCDYIIKEMGPAYAITERQARAFKEAYFGTYEGLRAYQERIKKQIEETRTLVNSFSRRCVFLGRPTGDTIRQAVAFIPQSTVGDLCNRTILRVVRELDEVEFLLQIHDALLLQTPAERLRESCEEVRRVMSMPITAHYTGLVYEIPVDVSVGRNWEELVDINEWTNKGE